ncbi:sugar diacid recognition domain-containing protein [Halobacillus rhizosphaerae]|uniref:CdaR family transcriptional regulator n=1 Tax=Halobacillus rhizosphaerae TaxID=3064889 RepID=UPI00398B8557
MELTEQLGQEIIHRLSAYITVPINLMNAKGTIVASTDSSRIYQPHGGAKNVIATEEPQYISSEDLDSYSNAKPGANLPVFHQGKLAGVVGLTGDPEQVMQAALMTQGSVEIALEQIYLQRQAFYQERQWSHWLQRLLNQENLDADELEREATYTLRVDIHQSFQVVIFQSHEPFHLAEKLRHDLEFLHPLFVLPYQEDRVVVSIPQHHLPHLELPERFNVKIGAGEPGYSVEGIRRSFHQAQAALEIAGTQGKIVDSASLKMERMLYRKNCQVYKEITEVYRDRLFQLERSYLLTLESYFTCNLKMNQTADHLHIHRNTLIYRLDQITKKVGLDPRTFREAILLQSILINQ